MLKDHQMESYVPGHDVVFHPCDLYNTLPETNIAPENGWLEDEMSY